MAFITLITAMIITEISLIGDRSLEDEKTDGKPMNVVVIGVNWFALPTVCPDATSILFKLRKQEQ